jgi:chromosomal replication initiator protein
MEHPEYTFERFIALDAAHDAVAACLAVAERPGVACNPLFLTGPTASGKTHLLHAIAHRLRKQHPGANVLRITAKDFQIELHAAVRSDTIHDFRQRSVAVADAVPPLPFLNARVVSLPPRTRANRLRVSSVRQ